MLNSPRFFRINATFLVGLIALLATLFVATGASFGQTKRIFVHTNVGKVIPPQSEIQRGTKWLSQREDGSTIEIVGLASDSVRSDGKNMSSGINPQLNSKRALWAWKYFSKKFPLLNFVNGGGGFCPADSQGFEMRIKIETAKNVAQALARDPVAANEVARTTLGTPTFEPVRKLLKKDWRFEPGVTYISTSHTERLPIPFLGVGLRYGHFELVGRGVVLPKVYKNSRQRFVFAELLVGATFDSTHNYGIALKLGGFQIKTKNWMHNDVQVGYGGAEAKMRIKGKFFLKPSAIWKTERLYRTELKRFKWDERLKATYQATLSAEL